MARPTDYNQQIADIICERISEGESLRAICREESMPCKAAVFRWLVIHKEFADQYAKAREEQAEAHADEIVNIVDNAANPLIFDGIPVLDAEGNPVMVTDAASIAHARLKMDARKWVASKLKPKKYGDKIGVEGSGENGEIITKMVIELVEPSGG